MLRIRANVKTEEVILPIGIFLPKQGERYDTCVVKGMDGDDEEAITEKRVRNNGAKMVTALLANKIIKVGDEDFPNGIGEKIAREMFSDDRDTCLVAIRKLMRDEMEFTTNCPRCNEEHNGIVYMSDLLHSVSKWGDNKELHDPNLNVGEVAFELPDGLIVDDDDTGKERVCRKGKLTLTTGAIEENIAKNGMRNAGQANSILLSSCISEIEGIRHVDQYVVKAMSRTDREYLADLMNEVKCGPKFLRDIECDSCGHEFQFFLQLPYFFTSGKKSQKK